MFLSVWRKATILALIFYTIPSFAIVFGPSQLLQKDISDLFQNQKVLYGDKRVFGQKVGVCVWEMAFNPKARKNLSLIELLHSQTRSAKPLTTHYIPFDDLDGALRVTKEKIKGDYDKSQNFFGYHWDELHPDDQLFARGCITLVSGFVGACASFILVATQGNPLLGVGVPFALWLKWYSKRKIFQQTHRQVLENINHFNGDVVHTDVAYFTNHLGYKAIRKAVVKQNEVYRPHWMSEPCPEPSTPYWDLLDAH